MKSDELKQQPGGTSLTTDAPVKDALKETVENSIDGIWRGEMVSEKFPSGESPAITFDLTADSAGKISGEIETARGREEVTGGEFNSKTGQLEFFLETKRGKREFSARVDGNQMDGEMVARNGSFRVKFVAKRKKNVKQALANIASIKTFAPVFLNSNLTINS